MEKKTFKQNGRQNFYVDQQYTTIQMSTILINYIYEKQQLKPSNMSNHNKPGLRFLHRSRKNQSLHIQSKLYFLGPRKSGLLRHVTS